MTDICENRHGGNQESAEAFRAGSATLRARQRFVIWAIAYEEGKRGVTTDEIAARLKTTPNVISGRMSELKRDGFLVPTNERRQTRMGRMARVFVASKPAA